MNKLISKFRITDILNKTKINSASKLISLMMIK